MTRWMVWVPWAAMIGALGYAGVQGYWAAGHAPTWVFGRDLTVPAWLAIGLCLAAVGVVAGLRASGGHRALIVAAWLIGLGLVSGAAMFLLDVVGRVLPGLGIPQDLPGFLSRGSCLAVGLLTAATALSWQRRTRQGCAHRPRLEATPRWAYVGAYAAVAGCLIRIVAQTTLGVSIPYAESPSLLIFEVGFLLGGVLLPLALVHGWGKVWPRWVLPLAGRRVPRWLVVGPGFAIATMLLAYFGVGMGQMVVETVEGTLEEPGFMWVAVPAYVLWGIGLAVASVAYYRITRPACASCGR